MNRIINGSEASKPFYTNGGKLSGAVYTDKKEHWDLISDVMRLSIEANPLHAIEFSYVG
jgi:hypothetical protein